MKRSRTPVTTARWPRGHVVRLPGLRLKQSLSDADLHGQLRLGPRREKPSARARRSGRTASCCAVVYSVAALFSQSATASTELPLLVALAAARVQLDQCTVGGTRPGDVQAEP